ncbi:uncharacterized protein LOC131737557 [Acipenser ruthenus]|uniref:uncharacterized protein LOC131737557 n=1 Tax=Acipenser ruthenus TaxID=7906 RepID=UPI00145B71CD|nr:uncharacterized protein LOC131737557 [Acipenser ruthenus]
MSNEEAGPSIASGSMMMFPFMMGASWAQRFKGGNCSVGDVSLVEWKSSLEAMFRIYALPETKQLDIVLSSLDGEAKREMQILPDESKRTVKQVFEKLEELYGDKTTASTLRSLFFSCRQKSTENIREFSLRLQELFSRMKKRDSRGIDIRREAVLRVEAFEGEESTVLQCQSSVQQKSQTVAEEMQLLRRELRAELQSDIQGKMNELTQSLLGELRAELQSWRSTSIPTESRADGVRPSHNRIESQYSTNRRQFNSYDPQGRPICRRCHLPGHIERYCGRPVSSSTEPLN